MKQKEGRILIFFLPPDKTISYLMVQKL